MCCSVLSPDIVMPDAYICGRLWRTKITHKASDVAENLQSSCSVLPPKIVMHDDAYIGVSENNIKCIVHDDLGWKNQTTWLFCCVTGFTSDFLSFIVWNLFSAFTEPFKWFQSSVCSGYHSYLLTCQLKILDGLSSANIICRGYGKDVHYLHLHNLWWSNE